MHIFHSFKVTGVLFLASQLAGANPASDSLTDPFARAAAENKLVLLHFVAPESPLAASTLRPGGAIRSDRFVEKEILPPGDPGLLARHGVFQFPTLIVLQPDGTELDRLVGNPPGSDIVSMLAAAARGDPIPQQLKARAKASGKMEEHGRVGDLLLRRGMHRDALDEFAWCLNQGPTADPAGFRRLLKTVLVRLSELQTRLPEAKAVLLKARQQFEGQLTPNAVDDYATAFAVNDALGDATRNAGLFCDLPANSQLRCELFPLVFQNLVSARRYREAVLTVDIETFVGRMFPLHIESDVPHPEGQLRHTHRIAAEARGRAIDSTLAAVEAAVGSGQLEPAKRLAGRLLDWSHSGDVRPHLVESAARANAPASAQFIVWVNAYSVQPASGSPAKL